MADISGNGVVSMCDRLITTSTQLDYSPGPLQLENVIEVASLISYGFVYSTPRLQSFVEDAIFDQTSDKKVFLLSFHIFF